MGKRRVILLKKNRFFFKKLVLYNGFVLFNDMLKQFLRRVNYRRCRENNKLISSFSGQGTIEYLVIIGVVIVLSLVVVGLVITQVDNSSNVSSVSSEVA